MQAKKDDFGSDEFTGVESGEVGSEVEVRSGELAQTIKSAFDGITKGLRPLLDAFNQVETAFSGLDDKAQRTKGVEGVVDSIKSAVTEVREQKNKWVGVQKEIVHEVKEQETLLQRQERLRKDQLGYVKEMMVALDALRDVFTDFDKKRKKAAGSEVLGDFSDFSEAAALMKAERAEIRRVLADVLRESGRPEKKSRPISIGKTGMGKIETSLEKMLSGIEKMMIDEDSQAWSKRKNLKPVRPRKQRDLILMLEAEEALVKSAQALSDAYVGVTRNLKSRNKKELPALREQAKAETKAKLKEIDERPSGLVELSGVSDHQKRQEERRRNIKGREKQKGGEKQKGRSRGIEWVGRVKDGSWSGLVQEMELIFKDLKKSLALNAKQLSAQEKVVGTRVETGVVENEEMMRRGVRAVVKEVESVLGAIHSSRASVRQMGSMVRRAAVVQGVDIDESGLDRMRDHYELGGRAITYFEDKLSKLQSAAGKFTPDIEGMNSALADLLVGTRSYIRESAGLEDTFEQASRSVQKAEGDILGYGKALGKYRESMVDASLAGARMRPGAWGTGIPMIERPEGVLGFHEGEEPSQRDVAQSKKEAVIYGLRDVQVGIARWKDGLEQVRDIRDEVIDGLGRLMGVEGEKAAGAFEKLSEQITFFTKLLKAGKSNIGLYRKAALGLKKDLKAVDMVLRYLYSSVNAYDNVMRGMGDFSEEQGKSLRYFKAYVMAAVKGIRLLDQVIDPNMLNKWGDAVQGTIYPLNKMLAKIKEVHSELERQIGGGSQQGVVPHGAANVQTTVGNVRTTDVLDPNMAFAG